MAYTDKVYHTWSANLNKIYIIQYLETSTKIFKNRCRGGHQSVGGGLTLLERKDIVIGYTFLLLYLQGLIKWHHQVTKICYCFLFLYINNNNNNNKNQ